MASSLPLDLTADYYLYTKLFFVVVRLTENGSRGVGGFFLAEGLFFEAVYVFLFLSPINETV